MTTTKKIVTVSLIVFTIIIIAIFVSGFFFKNANLNDTTLTELNSQFTTNDIALHNTASDCWTIVDGKVYDLTNYINFHPAGPETIIPSCGKDGTVRFNTRGEKGPHPRSAQEKLINYYLGDINQSINN